MCVVECTLPISNRYVLAVFFQCLFRSFFVWRTIDGKNRLCPIENIQSVIFPANKSLVSTVPSGYCTDVSLVLLK